ncbi:MAG TPA: hypothetical protein VMF69_17860 [Gemmataceae bacterium]|nr:hypothetical protein [Gemmataceae bacterium]
MRFDFLDVPSEKMVRDNPDSFARLAGLRDLQRWRGRRFSKKVGKELYSRGKIEKIENK